MQVAGFDVFKPPVALQPYPKHFICLNGTLTTKQKWDQRALEERFEEKRAVVLHFLLFTLARNPQSLSSLVFL